jgi:hypothetical protein
VTKELKQFNMYNVSNPIKAKSLSVEDCKNTFSSLIFLMRSKMGILRHNHALPAACREIMLLRRKRLHPL